MTGPPAVTPLGPVLGVEVRGVDLAALAAGDDPAGVSALRRLVLDHLVVAVPEQILDIDGHVALAGRFGPVTPSSAVLPGLDAGHPEVKVIDTRRWDGRLDYWHADMPYVATPTALSVLYARVVPPSGSALLWASTEAAYASLPPATQARLVGLRAVHHAPQLEEYARAFGPGTWDGESVSAVEPVEHPVVRRHPETGRLGLYLNPWSVRALRAPSAGGRPGAGAGASVGEPAGLLDDLLAHLVRPEHVLSYAPEPGTVVLVDTRATAHRMAEHDPDQVRVVHRVSVRGDRPVGP